MNLTNQVGVIAQTLPSSLAHLIDDFDRDIRNPKEQFEIDEDLLVLSTTWKRLRDEFANGGKYIPVSKLLDKELRQHITDVDRQLALEIRDYYSKKIMIWKLKNVHLSKFREDMNQFVHSSGKTISNEICPLVYRLPEFYEYDVALEQLLKQHEKRVSSQSRVAFDIKQTLTLQKTFIVGKKYVKRKEYWFSNENNNLAVLALNKDNPLIPLLDLHCKKTFSITSKSTVVDRDGAEYINLDKYTFI